MNAVRCKSPDHRRLSGALLISGHTTLLFLTVVVLIGTFTADRAFGLADFNTPGNLPASYANAVVRIQVQKNGNTYGESGVVINVGAKDKTGGQYLCILTADHGLRSNNGGLPTQIGIGFRGANTFPLSIGGAAVAQQVTLLGTPGNKNGGGPDLAVVRVYVPAGQAAAVPAITTPAITAPTTTAGNAAIQAGYGDTATIATVAGTNVYQVQSSYGTYTSGTNTIAGTAANFTDAAIPGGGNYGYSAIQGGTTFTTDGKGNVTAATSYVLSGDSGGPTFQMTGPSTFGLVGIHSYSTTVAGAGANAGNTYVIPGANQDVWTDVNVSAYQEQIAAACAPEPATLVLLAAGCIALLVRPRKSKPARRLPWIGCRRRQWLDCC